MLRLFMVCFCLLLCGCNVARQLQGAPEPDISIVKIGATRAEVEALLGPPAATRTIEGKQWHLYEYQSGYEADGTQAMGVVYGDILTLGLGEILLGEKALQTIRRVRIEYGADNRVIDIYKYNPPKQDEAQPATETENTADDAPTEEAS